MDKTAQDQLNQDLKILAEKNIMPDKNICEGVLTKGKVKSAGTTIEDTFKVAFQSKSILNIVSTSEYFGYGAMHSLESIISTIINTDAGKTLSANDIFGKNIPQVNQFIYDQLKKR